MLLVLHLLKLPDGCLMPINKLSVHLFPIKVEENIPINRYIRYRHFLFHKNSSNIFQRFMINKNNTKSMSIGEKKSTLPITVWEKRSAIEQGRMKQKNLYRAILLQSG